MRYKFITGVYTLTKEEQEKADFINGTKKAMGLVQNQRPDQAKVMALQSFEGELVVSVVDRIGLKDKSPIAILLDNKVITCYVGEEGE